MIRWRPDTCECVLLYSGDAETAIRNYSYQIEKKCQAHASIADSDLMDQILNKEQRVKETARWKIIHPKMVQMFPDIYSGQTFTVTLNKILATLPTEELVKYNQSPDKQQELQNQARIAITESVLQWSFNADRKLEFTIKLAIGKTRKNQLQAELNKQGKGVKIV